MAEICKSLFILLSTDNYFSYIQYIHSSYRPQRSWGKVIFSQASVILLTGVCYPSMHCRWYPSIPCSRSPEGVSAPGACLLLGGGLLLWPSGLVAFWLKTAFWYGLWGPEGHNRRPPHQAITEGHHRKGVCLVETPHTTHPPGTATAAGGSHPTGMHSCFMKICSSKMFPEICIFIAIYYNPKTRKEVHVTTILFEGHLND